MRYMLGRRRATASFAWLLLITAAAGGCPGVSSGQLKDFGLTEIARVIADLIGQFFGILVQASAPGAVQ